VRTSVSEERLLVISDLHMGNRLHRPKRALLDFLRFAIEHDYSICVNGDGVDLVHLSFSQLTDSLSASIGLFRKLGQRGRRIYYTVGNHDIALEHFLPDLGVMAVVPFLNVHSGDKRFRIEHGHTYDTMFLRFPRLYAAFTYIGRLSLAIGPGFYRWIENVNHRVIDFGEFLLSGFRTRAARLRGKKEERIEGERECFALGAEEVGVRGFDAVIFGHTHIPGAIRLPSGIRYFNTGGWFTTAACVAIDRGRVWYGLVSDLVANPDPFPLGSVDTATEADATVDLGA